MVIMPTLIPDESCQIAEASQVDLGIQYSCYVGVAT